MHPQRIPLLPLATLPLLLLLLLLPALLAVKLEIPALPQPGGKQCVSQFLPKDTLLVGSLDIGAGFNMQLDMEVCYSSSFIHQNS